MPEQHEPPRPHGDPLEDEVVNNESNAAQRQSDAAGDAVNVGAVEEPTRGTGSSANGISASDEDDGAARKKRYDDGAELVSKID